MSVINTIIKSFIVDKSINILIDGLISNLYSPIIISGQINNQIPPIGTYIEYIVIDYTEKTSRTVMMDCHVIDDDGNCIYLVSSHTYNNYKASVQYTEIDCYYSNETGHVKVNN